MILYGITFKPLKRQFVLAISRPNMIKTLKLSKPPITGFMGVRDKNFKVSMSLSRDISKE